MSRWQQRLHAVRQRVGEPDVGLLCPVVMEEPDPADGVDLPPWMRELRDWQLRRREPGAG